ncbi:MerR family transcriptional regulator [Chloroflexota bacterium]
MPVIIDGQIYYRTSELCRNIGISRSTLFRWLRQDMLEKSYRDRRGWRLFTEDDLNKIKMETTRVDVE